MANKNPYRIKDNERGHRPALSGEPTKILTVCVPESLHKKCRVVGPKKIREQLEKMVADDLGN